MKTRSLPRNISAHPDGFLVRVERHSVRYQAFVSSRHPDSLSRAIAIRDRFYRVVGEVMNKHKVVGQSNTGLAGVTETINWRHNRPGKCFVVSWHEGQAGQRRQRTRRFYWHNPQSRQMAFASAKDYRQRMAFPNGQPSTTKLECTHI